MIPYISPVDGQTLRRGTDGLQGRDGARFPVVGGIPRFVETQGYSEAFGYQWKAFSKLQLDSHTGHNLSRERLERCIGATCETLKGLDTLEVGCGAGRFTELLVQAGANVHAVDLSHAVEANLENVGTRPNYQVAQASVYDLPYPQEIFDVVICLGVVQHTPSPERTIRDLYRMVKPGGLLVIDHYRLQHAYFSSTAFLVRPVLKRLPPPVAMRAVKAMTDMFFPIQWRLRGNRVPYALVNRMSPLCIHFLDNPELSEEYQREWTVLDSFDNLTDAYKHLRTPRQIRRALQALPRSEDIWVEVGGNGVEARCRKAINSPS